MSDRLTSYSFSYGPVRATPVAVIRPEEQYAVIGTKIVLDGAQSLSEDGAGLSYAWEITERPVGSSSAELAPLFPEDPSSVQLKPDVAGPYEVTLTVSTPWRTSAPVRATVYAQVLDVPHGAQVTPDGQFFFRVVSDFWQSLENKDALPILWSGYKQLLANDFLRLFQWEFGRSIKNIQEAVQRPWLAIKPELPLDGAQITTVLGYHQGGSAAFTSSASTRAQVIVLSASAVRIFRGTLREARLGSRISIYEGANVGTYDLVGPTGDGRGLLISSATPLPNPSGDELASATDLAMLPGDPVVLSASVNFVTAGVQAGDVLAVEGGLDAGTYRVIGVGVVDGLPSNLHVELDTPMREARAGVGFSVVRPVGAVVAMESVPLVDTVYIPRDDADFSVYSRAQLSGSATVVGPYELIAEQRHIYEALVGRRITLTSGPGAGRAFSVAGINASRTGYLVSSPLPGPFPGTASYVIPVVTDISSRLLILDDQAYEIDSVSLEEDHLDVGLGGTGPVWAVRLLRSEAPSGRTDLSWKIGSTLESREVSDFEILGVRPNDVLEVRVSRTDFAVSAIVQCRVLGSRGNKLAFEWGLADDTLSDAQILAASRDLHVSYAYEDDAGEAHYVEAAAAIISDLRGFDFRQAYWNLDVSAETVFLTGGMSFRAEVAGIIRNTQLPVQDDLISVPRLQEFIVDPGGATTESGEYVYVARGQLQVTLPRPPTTSVEGRDHFVGGKAQTTGTSAEVAAGSDIVELHDADLLRQFVRPGDVLELEDGPSPGRYVIQEVLTATSIRVLGEDGSLPTRDGAAISYLIDRRVDGRFIYFARPFTPLAPAPRSLWAPLTLWDGSQYIEDNYGTLVGVTKAALDEFGSSQVTYRGAVKGLLYAWTSNRSIQSILVGASILAGLPVAEERSIVRDVDPNYRAGQGRILLEALGADGSPTGVLTPYFYASDTSQTEVSYAGLATNPKTGAEYKIGDIVEENLPLTNGVQIRDWVSHPDWWAAGPPGTELQKYHSWELSVDAAQIDSRDLSLVQRFAMAVRDIRTLPKIVLVRFLADDVTVEDALLIEISQHLYDDPAAGLEATHLVGAYSGAVSLRKLGFPTSGMRTVFEGYDLATSAGTGNVTSARGGFVTPVTSISPSFPGPATTLGAKLVRGGDILSILTGPNRGRYQVSSVTSDTALVLIECVTPYPPVSPPIDTILSGTGQRFVIERPMTNPLVSGSDLVLVASPKSVTSATGNFIWNGVMVGDYLVLPSGSSRGRYLICGVTDTQLELAPSVTLVSATGVSFYVEREALRRNPLLAASNGVTAAGAQTLVASGTNPDLLDLRTEDEVRILSGTDAGRVFRVIDAGSNVTIWVDKPFTATETDIQFEVIRPRLGGSEGSVDSDDVLEQFFVYDPLRSVLYRPVTPLAGGPYTTSSFQDGTPARVVFTVDVEAAGAEPGMFVEVRTGDNVGVYEITDVSGNTVETENGAWPTPGVAAASAHFVEEALVFAVQNSTVQHNGGVNLEFLATDPTTLTGTVSGIVGAVVTGSGTAFLSEVQAGQLFRIAADNALAWTRVLKVASNTSLTLTETYRGAGSAGAAESSPDMGGIRPGDRFVYEGRDNLAAAHVRANTVTLTRDTGEAVLVTVAGHFERLMW